VSCKETSCDRRAQSRGWCTTHYRRWRSGQPMDAAIRGYVRVEVAEDGKCKPLTTRLVRQRQRERPFAAEYALLAELGLSAE
jgi:hypothetical protein